MTSKQKYGTAIVIVVLLLIYFLYYYFILRKKKEKCPDGRNIPSSGNCSDNPVKYDSSGNVLVSEVPKADASGCLSPSSYIVNAFPLTLGMKGDLVKQLQMALNRDYNTQISEDGFFGCLTLSAIKTAYNVDSVDAQLFKDKVTPLVNTPPKFLL